MKPVPPPPPDDIRRAVRTALQEDLTHGDVTTDAVLEQPISARARILTEQTMVVAGVLIAQSVFDELDAAVQVRDRLADGMAASPGQTILELSGSARSLLMGERVALNFLQRLSGIATHTARFVRAVRGYRCQILDTRKTTPGLRSLEKWAVRLGGGANHRQSLGDGLLIKDNHLALLRARGIGTAEACRLARARGPHGLKVIIEADTLTQVRGALDGAADVILLDNMSPAEVRQAADLIKGRAVIEVSGGISLENAREFAAAGANYLSIGALTHSAPAVSLTMELDATHRRTRRSNHGRSLRSG
jgi:nicotinate-nucleotide pyrophosphorylase (carboxylating)